MHQNNQPIPIEKIPRTKNVWLRLTKYFIVATIVSYFLYWVMSQMDSDSLNSINNKRSAIFLMMLNIMPAKGWGWFAFIANISASAWGEWRYFHLKSFPKEVERTDKNTSK